MGDIDYKEKVVVVRIPIEIYKSLIDMPQPYRHKYLNINQKITYILVYHLQSSKR